MSTAGLSEALSAMSGEGDILAAVREIMGCVHPSSETQGNFY